jgi:hypothetical protein
MTMDTGKRVDVLITEYNRLSAEIRMYVQEFSPRLTIFGTIGLGAIGFAWGNERYQIVFAIIPYLIMFIGSVTSAQAYIISCIALRLREIEDEISEINGAPVLRWESHCATGFIFSVVLKTKSGRRAINPIVVSLSLAVLTIGAIIFFCIVRSFLFLPNPWGGVYVVITVSTFGLLIGCALSFFFVGRGTAWKQGGGRSDREN